MQIDVIDQLRRDAQTLRDVLVHPDSVVRLAPQDYLDGMQQLTALREAAARSGAVLPEYEHEVAPWLSQTCERTPGVRLRDLLGGDPAGWDYELLRRVAARPRPTADRTRALLDLGARQAETDVRRVMRALQSGVDASARYAELVRGCMVPAVSPMGHAARLRHALPLALSRDVQAPSAVALVEHVTRTYADSSPTVAGRVADRVAADLRAWPTERDGYLAARASWGVDVVALLAGRPGPGDLAEALLHLPRVAAHGAAATYAAATRTMVDQTLAQARAEGWLVKAPTPAPAAGGRGDHGRSRAARAVEPLRRR